MNQKKIVYRYISGTVLLFLIVLSIYGFLIEPYDIEIHHIWIKDPYLSRILGGKIVLHLSDLHIGTFGPREQKVLEISTSLKPDIIFMTGDYVPWQGDYEPALHFLSRLKAKTGIWAVMGDYDYSNSRKSCLFCHEKGSEKPTQRHSVRFLRDNIDTLKLAEGSINIAGIDINKRWPGDSRLLSRLNKSKLPAILLSHNPLTFDSINGDLKLLMLAGDTHGGQIALPSWFFRILGYRKNASYSHGLFERNGNKLFVTRGIGISHLPVRIFRKPEISVLHFTP